MLGSHLTLLRGTAAASLAEVLNFFNHSGRCLIFGLLLIIQTIIRLFKTAEEHGEEEIEQDQVQHDVQNWEEN